MKALAWNDMWWPGMDADIEEKVNHCNTSQSSRTFSARAPLHPLEWSREPLHRIYLDYANYNARNLHIITNAHSKWKKVHLTLAINSTTTIEKSRYCFATHGLPNLLVSDNGPCFTSLELAEFIRKNGIKHNLVSPYHQSSYGQAESSVKIDKMDREEYQVEHWKQSFHDPYSPTGQHPIPQLELHQQNSWWKESYRQIWTGWGHPPLPLYSSAKIIRNSIMIKLPRWGCFTKFWRFLSRTLTVAQDGWPSCFGGYWCPIFLDKITRRTSYSSETMSLTPVNNPGPEKIESRFLSQLKTAPWAPNYTLDTVMPENPQIPKSTVAMSTPLWQSSREVEVLQSTVAMSTSLWQSSREITAPQCFTPG